MNTNRSYNNIRTEIYPNINKLETECLEEELQEHDDNISCNTRNNQPILGSKNRTIYSKEGRDEISSKKEVPVLRQDCNDIETKKLPSSNSSLITNECSNARTLSKPSDILSDSVTSGDLDTLTKSLDYNLYPSINDLESQCRERELQDYSENRYIKYVNTIDEDSRDITLENNRDDINYYRSKTYNNTNYYKSKPENYRIGDYRRKYSNTNNIKPYQRKYSEDYSDTRQYSGATPHQREHFPYSYRRSSYRRQDTSNSAQYLHYRQNGSNRRRDSANRQNNRHNSFARGENRAQYRQDRRYPSHIQDYQQQYSDRQVSSDLNERNLDFLTKFVKNFLGNMY